MASENQDSLPQYSQKIGTNVMIKMKKWTGMVTLLFHVCILVILDIRLRSNCE
jgi:hypothetical protein